MRTHFTAPSDHVSNFGMIDVGSKRPTRRVAVATGTIWLGAEAFAALRAGSLPKGNVLALAESAAINGAKNTPVTVPMCHSIGLDAVNAHFSLQEKDHSVAVFVQTVATAKTGVEMEALAGVNAALLTIWDLTKGINPALRIGNVELLVKTGGKSGVWKNQPAMPAWLEQQLPALHPLSGFTASVLVMSDRASSGVYQDSSGAYLQEALKKGGATVKSYAVIADDAAKIEKNLTEICTMHMPHIVLASGGTGPGPRDITPDILAKLCDRTLEGLGEWLRRESLYFTETAWLSRMMAGMVGDTLVIALPGSLKAVQECWQILEPVLPLALQRIQGQRNGAKNG